jgi:glutamine synthetase
VRDTLDERLRGWFLRNKRAEWDHYQATVSGAERDRLLRAL